LLTWRTRKESEIYQWEEEELFKIQRIWETFIRVRVDRNLDLIAGLKLARRVSIRSFRDVMT
jgi:hypothetical protein